MLLDDEIDGAQRTAQATASVLGRALNARSVTVLDQSPAIGRHRPLACWSADENGAPPLREPGSGPVTPGGAHPGGPWLLVELHPHWRAGDVARPADTATRSERDGNAAALAPPDQPLTDFLLDWCDTMRGLGDPDAMVVQTLARIGARLGVAWLGLAEDGVAGHRWWRRDDAPPGPPPMAEPPLSVTGDSVAPEDRDGNRLSAATGAQSVLVSAGPTSSTIRLIAADTAGRLWHPSEAAVLDSVAARLEPMLAQARELQRKTASEALLSAFMERAPLGIFVKDSERRFIRANPELAAAFGIPLDGLIGRRTHDVLHPAMARRIESVEDQARHGATASDELSDPRRDDHSTVLAVSFPLAGAGDAMIGGFTIDLTERKQAEAALEKSREALHQSEKLSAMGSLLAGVSHELNNPLSIVTAQADLIVHEAGIDGTVGRRAAKLREAAERCARIVRTFLAMARREPPERRPVAIGPLVESALDLVGYGLASHGIAIERRFEPDLPTTEADADQIHQIVVNLLVNAQQALAGRPEPRMVVRTRAEDGRLIVEVGDNGPGVPADVRRRIFDPFFTTKPQGQGTGMGLAFSQGLAEAHGGSLTLVASEADAQHHPNSGAVFRLSLPVVGVAPVADDAGEPSALRSSRRRRLALVAAETRDTGNAIAALLQQEGYRSQVVTGGTAAQALLGTGSFDLIVAETGMQGVDGAALFRWMQRIRPDLTKRIVFVMSEPRHASTMALMFESGAPHLSKPVPATALRDALATVEASR